MLEKIVKWSKDVFGEAHIHFQNRIIPDQNVHFSEFKINLRIKEKKIL